MYVCVYIYIYIYTCQIGAERRGVENFCERGIGTTRGTPTLTSNS